MPAAVPVKVPVVGDVPREYQLQLFERAKAENIIACADTGTGKTLVAVLLLKHMLEAEHARLEAARTSAGQRVMMPKRRVSAMLVLHVPLVHQQAAYIEANSPLKVARLYGETNVDLWDAGQWRTLLGEADCIVCTAQILKDALAHAFVSLDDLNLIVFDEVHHATKDAVYARIMQSHYFEFEGERPKIFGMTASPISSKNQDFMQAGTELETCMDAKLFTAPVESSDSLQRATFKAQTVEVKYDRMAGSGLSDFCQRVQERVVREGGPKGFVERFVRLGPALGPALCDLVLEETLKEGGADDGELKRLQGLSQEARDEIMRNWNQATEKAKSLEHKLKTLGSSTQLNAQLRSIVEEERSKDRAEGGTGEESVSPKVAKLCELLQDIFRDTGPSRGIIFAKEKLAVVALTKYLSKLFEPQSIALEAMVGHGGRQGLTWKQQQEVLRRFRKGATRVLVATNVVEEGLDVPACNFVIRFDLPDTPLQMIQSRGRARERDSKMYLLHQDGEKRERKLIDEFKQSEENMKDWLHHLPEDRHPAVTAAGSEEGSAGAADYVGSLKSEHTAAKVEAKEAAALLNRYVQSLPGDVYTSRTPQWLFEDMGDGVKERFCCILRMPAHSKLREVTSSWQQSKRIAKQEASLEACRELYRLHELDENLLPRKPPRLETEKMEVEDEHGEVRSVTSHSLPRPTASFFAAATVRDRGTFWATRLSFDAIGEDALHGRVASLLLLTAEKPSATFDIELSLLNGPVHIPWQPADGREVNLSGPEIELAKAYTSKVISMVARVAATPNPTLCSWMLLPTRAGSAWDLQAVDWDQVKHLTQPDHAAFLAADTLDYNVASADVVITRSPDFKASAYAVRDTRYELTPSGPAPEGSYQARTGQTLQQEYERQTGQKVRGDGPLLEVERLPRMQNFATVWALRSMSRRVDYFMPAVTYVHPLPASVYRAIILLPSFLERVNAISLAHECNANVLKNIAIPTQDLIAALTAPSAALAFSYQRSEFIGDSTLKLLATCFAFVELPDADEGQLTNACMNLISNAALAKHSMRLNLWRYVCTEAFVAKSWVPPAYNIMDDQTGQPQPPTVSWTAKRLADIVEALLGSVPSASIDDKLRVARELELLPKQLSSFSDFRTSLENSLIAWPRDVTYGTQMATLERLMTTIGHRFQRPFFALSAITHASFVGSAVPSYDRLEVLGDALLDYFVVDMLQSTYGVLQEGELTILKSNCVNNKTLAALAVSQELHKFLLQSNSQLSGAIAAYAEEVTDARMGEVENPSMPHQYWWGISAPKACADIVESILGAVLVDSGFDLDVARDFFNLNYRPFLEHHCRLENALLSSPELLFDLLLRRRCKQWTITGFENETAPGDGDTNMQMSEEAEGMDIDGDEDSAVIAPKMRGIRIEVHKTTFGQIPRPSKALVAQAREAVIMLQRFQQDEAGSSIELGDVLRALWPSGPLRSSRLAVSRQQLEALCRCHKE